MTKRVLISTLALVTLGLFAAGAVAQAREGESGDDRRGHGASLTIQKSMAREPQPGDDRGGSRGAVVTNSKDRGLMAREPQVGDDRGRGGPEPQPGEDRGGLG